MRTSPSLRRHLTRVAVGSVVMASGVALSGGLAHAVPAGKVTICHRTDSNTNPYVTITVSINAADGSLGKGNNDHTHHSGPVYNPTLKSQHIKWGDIIPPYSYSGGDFAGQNWGPDGQVILARDCNYAGPDLAMDKIGTTNATPGDSVTYTLTVTNQPTADATYGKITVTDTLPAGLSNGTLTPLSSPGDWTCTGMTCSTTTLVIQPGSSVVFTVTADVDQNVQTPNDLTDVADVDTPGDTDPSNDEDDAVTHVDVEIPFSPAPLVLSASCSDTDGKVLWTVTNPDGNPDVSNLDVNGSSATPDPSSLAAGESATFVTDPLAPANTLSVTGSYGEGGSVESNKAGFSDPCAPPPPAPVTNPAVSSSKACATGISVVLSNMDADAPVTFAVSHKGSIENVTVRADQIVKRSYAVKEDTTGTVTVRAAGLKKKVVSYAKDCATVLGTKTVKPPVHKPTTTPSVLPFTGSPTSNMVTTGVVSLLAGLVLAVTARRRRSSRHAAR